MYFIVHDTGVFLFYTIILCIAIWKYFCGVQFPCFYYNVLYIGNSIRGYISVVNVLQFTFLNCSAGLSIDFPFLIFLQESAFCNSLHWVTANGVIYQELHRRKATAMPFAPTQSCPRTTRVHGMKVFSDEFAFIAKVKHVT